MVLVGAVRLPATVRRIVIVVPPQTGGVTEAVGENVKFGMMERIQLNYAATAIHYVVFQMLGAVEVIVGMTVQIGWESLDGQIIAVQEILGVALQAPQVVVTGAVVLPVVQAVIIV